MQANHSSSKLLFILLVLVGLFTSQELKLVKAFSVLPVSQRALVPTASSSSTQSSSTSLSSSSSSDNNNNDNDNLPNIKAAVIVPGFLTGADEFEPLVQKLKERGIPSIAVPFPNWHWIPCLGGRSARPILERIDYAVKYLCANPDCIDDNGNDTGGTGGTGGTGMPKFEYNAIQCYQDFMDNPGGVFAVGGSEEADLFPKNIQPRGGNKSNDDDDDDNDNDDAKGKIILIGHSAGGWISRVYLSNRDYGGKTYNGSQYVHTLITLGTPHGNAPGPAFRSIDWINREKVPSKVRSLAVAGKGFNGSSSGQFTQNAYSFCCNEGSDGSIYDGDGVTPVQSSLAMDGEDDNVNCEKMILEGDTTHFPWNDVFGGEFTAPDLAKRHREGTPWYGSDEALDQWVGWLLKDEAEEKQ